MHPSRQQPQRIPPPITYGDEALDSGVVLQELTGNLALLLWKTVRSVRLWTELPAGQRGGAFSPGAYAARLERLKECVAAPELLQALREAARVLQSESPSPFEVADACARAADWAEGQGATGTALELVQAAALAVPSDASLAHAVARMARRRAEYSRAETWYRQAIFAARRTRDRDSLVRSYCGLGISYVSRGSYPSARQAFLRGLHAARRHSLHERGAMLLHELAGVAIRTGQRRDVERYAQAALEAYGAGHPRLPALAHDVAVFWMNRGYFAAALSVFEAIPAEFGDADDRLVLAASRARAAGGAGDAQAFSGAWDDATARMDGRGSPEREVTALVELARGAESLGEWDLAQEAAGKALQLASARGEGEKRLEAESVLESIRRSRAAGSRAAGRPVRAPRQVQWLARELAARMSTVAGGG